MKMAIAAPNTLGRFYGVRFSKSDADAALARAKML
jgi:hypothetical protein